MAAAAVPIITNIAIEAGKARGVQKKKSTETAKTERQKTDPNGLNRVWFKSGQAV
ncbi:hypothetical protein A2U01_0103754, partial [Trifolium medium]|nr:hypothetical protein [Trifolium medium]